jgi:hypothetical protein
LAHAINVYQHTVQTVNLEQDMAKLGHWVSNVKRAMFGISQGRVVEHGKILRITTAL